ncbi:GNAT family N-acetyltransferase, partial [Pseudoalteromonas sp. TB6-MNA-CIBAN-0076]
TWFGASFGATAQLLNFWQSLGFNAVKLGYQRDKSTAEHATLVVKSLNAPQQSLQSLIKQFQYELFYGLLSHFKSLEWQLVNTLLRSFNDEVIA